MAKTLMQQIEEDEKLLNPPTEDDNAEGNEPSQPEKPDTRHQWHLYPVANLF